MANSAQEKREILALARVVRVRVHVDGVVDDPDIPVVKLQQGRRRIADRVVPTSVFVVEPDPITRETAMKCRQDRGFNQRGKRHALERNMIVDNIELHRSLHARGSIQHIQDTFVSIGTAESVRCARYQFGVCDRVASRKQGDVVAASNQFFGKKTYDLFTATVCDWREPEFEGGDHSDAHTRTPYTVTGKLHGMLPLLPELVAGCCARQTTVYSRQH